MSTIADTTATTVVSRRARPSACALATGSTTPTGKWDKATGCFSCCSTSEETSTTGTLRSLDALAVGRRVIAFDNAGVGGSSGNTPDTIAPMASDAIAFLDAMHVECVDILGFSIGSFVAQEIALQRPASIRRLVLASAAPQGAPGMHGWAPEVIAAVGARDPNPDGYLDVFYTQSPHSRQAGQESLRRMLSRSTDRDEPTSWQTRQAQYDAVCAWGVANHALLQRVGTIELPVFVANGDSDPMILPRYSYLLAGLIPHATLKIYDDSGHGFLFQHHEEFASDVLAFLD